MTRKTAFFEGWSWFKFNNLGLALGTNLKFYISLSKGLKLKVRKFWRLILTFAEVTGEKLVGGPFAPPPPPSWIGLRESFIHLRRTCENISLSFKTLKGMFPKDYFVSSNVEIISSTSLGVTGRKEKGLIVMYLPLIFFILGWFF